MHAPCARERYNGRHHGCFLLQPIQPIYNPAKRKRYFAPDITERQNEEARGAAAERTNRTATLQEARTSADAGRPRDFEHHFSHAGSSHMDNAEVIAVDDMDSSSRWWSRSSDKLVQCTYPWSLRFGSRRPPNFARSRFGLQKNPSDLSRLHVCHIRWLDSCHARPTYPTPRHRGPGWGWPPPQPQRTRKWLHPWPRPP